VPFSYYDAENHVVGFSQELARRVIEAIKQKLAADPVLLAWCSLVDELGLKASGLDDVALFGQSWIECKISSNGILNTRLVW
jgi:ABC-type amino acid transport substrate-binding protein